MKDILNVDQVVPAIRHDKLALVKQKKKDDPKKQLFRFILPAPMQKMRSESKSVSSAGSIKGTPKNTSHIILKREEPAQNRAFKIKKIPKKPPSSG